MKNCVRISGFLWSLSFAMATLPVQPIEITRMGAIVLSMVAVCGLLWAGRTLPEKTLAAPRIAAFFLLFLVLVIASAAWSVAPAVSLLYAGAFAVLPATVLALCLSDDDQRMMFIRAAAWGVGGIIVAVAAWAIIQTFFFPQLLVNGQVRSPFVNPNVFAALLNMAFFSGLALYLSAPSIRHRRIIWVGVLIVLVAFASVASKAGSITFFVGLVMMAVMVERSIWHRYAKALMVLAALVLMMAVIMSFLPGKTTIWGQLAGYAQGDYATAMNRIDIWAATVDLIRQAPFLGSGYKTFYLIYPSVRLPSEVYSGGFMAHSDPLQFWAETGLGGIVLFYAIGIGVLWRFIKWHCATPSPLVTGLFIAAAGLVAHSHVDFPFYTLSVAMMFALVLSTVLILTPGPGDGTVRPFSFVRAWPRAHAFMLLVLPLAVFMGLFISLMLGEYFTALAKRQINDGNTAGFASSVNLANRVGLGLNARPYMMAATVPLGILKDGFMTMGLDEQRALFHQTDTLLQQASRMNTRLATVPFHRAELIQHSLPLVWPETFPRTEVLYRQALAIDPLHLPSRMGLARNLLAQGRSEELYILLLAGLNWPYPGYDAKTYYRFTAEQARLRKDQKTIDQIAEIERLYDSRVASARRRMVEWQKLKDDASFLP